ncbi:MAG: DUF2089 domain-containing protein [Chloroflexota bacterium]
MNPVLTTCPVCGERLSVTRLHCRSCDTTLEGHFEVGRLGRLSPEQLAFVETFIRCEGKLNRMERELGMSYPTLRSRLTEIIRDLGFPVGAEAHPVSDDDRHRILDDLAAGRITSDQAMRLLQGE